MKRMVGIAIIAYSAISCDLVRSKPIRIGCRYSICVPVDGMRNIIYQLMRSTMPWLPLHMSVWLCWWKGMLVRFSGRDKSESFILGSSSCKREVSLLDTLCLHIFMPVTICILIDWQNMSNRCCKQNNGGESVGKWRC